MKCIVAAVFAVALSLPCLAIARTLSEEWHSWKTRHEKVYVDSSDENVRRQIWIQNRARIEAHNHGNRSFSLALNQFADMAEHEIREAYLMQDLVKVRYDVDSGHYHESSNLLSYPEKWDWRTKGLVTDVNDQRRCKAGWAFSATGAMEGQYARSSGQLVALSAQQLVDCSWKYGSQGCNGGSPSKAFSYIVDNGICSSTNYPFLGFMWQCMAQYCGKSASAIDERMVRPQNETDLLDALYHVGPISVMIDASSYNFLFYEGGVFSDANCGSDETNLGHAMLLVGYVDYEDSDTSYWILKNSWGASWGINGYMMLLRGENMCGVATQASYPVVISS